MGRLGDKVLDAQGVEGKLVGTSTAGVTGEATVHLPQGETVLVPCNLISPAKDGTYQLRGAFADWRRPDRTDARRVASEKAAVIPLAEESIRVEQRERETGRVRIAKHVTEHTERIDEPILHDEVDVRRVPIGKILRRPVGIRHEGDTTIIPVLEERLVIQKQLILKEELHVTRRTTASRQVQDITLRAEDVDVTRIPPANVQH